MRTRTNKVLALGAMLIIPALVVNLAIADGAQEIKIHFAGGFVRNLQQMQVDMMDAPTGILESRSLALIKGRGTFGRVDIMAVTVSGPPVSGSSCSAGLVKVADIVENNLVLTFSDLSMLYGNGTGAVCLDPSDPTAFPLAEIDGTWNGGTGRFGQAGGSWSIRFDFAERVGMTTEFIAEAGVINGHLTGVGDDD